MTVLVKIADWTSEDHDELAVIEPEPTDRYVALTGDGPDPAA